jgi:hypothetical protein
MSKEKNWKDEPPYNMYEFCEIFFNENNMQYEYKRLNSENLPIDICHAEKNFKGFSFRDKALDTYPYPIQKGILGCEGTFAKYAVFILKQEN